MAIKVRNNLAAMRSLGQLNINITELGKALTRVASGQKINSAGDDASGLAISERMRVQIRALAQDVQNVKNGSSMLEIASGGVGNIVDVLREMKKLAIDAANDSNSDEDRRTIQKELKQRMLTINDVAIGTNYNGKRLIDGTYDVKTITETEQVGWNEPHTITMVPGKTYTKTVNVDGSRVIVGVNNVQDMTANFSAADESIADDTILRSRTMPPLDCDEGWVATKSTWNWSKAYKEANFAVETSGTSSTPQQVIKDFMSSLNNTNLAGVAALDEAVSESSSAIFSSKAELVQQFMSDLAASSSYADFLETYCDIDLNNADTGAITGNDADDSNPIKTPESIVPEYNFPVTSAGFPQTSYSKFNGLTVNWPSYGADGETLTDAEKHILAALNSDWMEQCTKLVTDSLGLDFNDSGASVRNIQVEFTEITDPTHPSYDALAWVTPSNYYDNQIHTLSLTVNMNWYKDINTDSEDGALLPSSPVADRVMYLDRTIAHEMTHAVMAANIDNIYDVPLYIMEGSAELVHGIDDYRGTTMASLLNKPSHLEEIFNTDYSYTVGGTDPALNDENYAAGYMLLRYLAKQSSEQTTYKDKYSTSPHTDIEIGVKIDFSGSTSADGSDLTVPDSYDNQGFSILCGGCAQYINIVFDADKNVGEADPLVRQGQRSDYVVGIKDITSQDDLARAIFEGIANASGRSTSNDIYVVHEDGTEELVCVQIDSHHNVRIAKDPTDPTKYVFLKADPSPYSASTPEMDFYDSGIIEATGGKGSKDDAPEGDEVQELDDYGEEIFDEDGNKIPHIQTIKVDTDTEVNIWEAKWETHSHTEGISLVIHDGTQAGQRNNYYIKNMQTKALTAGKIFDADEMYMMTVDKLLNESDRAHYEALSNDPDKQEEWLATLRHAANMTVDDILVTTVHDANIAIRVLDGALEYALDNATRLGAYLERLETDEGNLVTSNENVTAAESTIRDADMAREMTSYTKANVLAQAAQAMLAQANQNSSAVLSLLQ